MSEYINSIFPILLDILFKKCYNLIYQTEYGNTGSVRNNREVRFNAGAVPPL